VAPILFSPLILRDLTLRNRIVVSPMCQYSSPDGLANDWHMVHLGSRAVGGAALVFTEAAAVTAEGRISTEDLGLWNDEQAAAMAPIFAFIKAQGAATGVQLAHAGRKASRRPPFMGGGPLGESDGGWCGLAAPSASPFDEGYQVPDALDESRIRAVVAAFGDAARRALQAGAEAIELHAAHGYLLHEFMSPLSNQRDDCYGGSFDNRIRLVCEVVEAVRAVWPERLPLFVRISATDWTEGGWTVEDSTSLAVRLAGLGVDLIDCSSSGNVARASVPVGPGYQVAFADHIKRNSAIKTGAVGLITSPEQAEHIVRSGQADVVLLARELLRDPYWPLRAARVLGHPTFAPAQYLRAF
jgi:2,4-dienoyl-CoA reductase-like NADH-dependent reductase (Old Yellow Enzyme family)